MTTLDNTGLWSRITVTIANGEATTGNIYDADAYGKAAEQAANLGFRLPGVYTDGDWTAADLLLETSLDGTNWQYLTDASGDPYPLQSLPTTGGFLKCFSGEHVVCGAMPYVRLRSVAVAGVTDANQAATRTLTMLLAR